MPPLTQGLTSTFRIGLRVAALGATSLLCCAPLAQAFSPGEAEVLASSPAPMTSVAVDTMTSVIYALEYEGTKAFSYDSLTNAWTEVAEAPINIGNNGGATYLNGKIYSSSTGNGTYLEVYDIASNTWTTIPSPLGKGTADITEVGEEIYMADETSFVKYNPATEVTTVLANAPEFAAAGCVSGFEPWGGLQPYQGKIYGDQGDGCRGFAVYDIASNTWTELPETPVVEGEPEGPVAGSALDPVSGTFFAYGGYEHDHLFEYNTAENLWTTFTLPFNVNDGGLAYVAVAGQRGVYAIQGQQGSAFVRYVTAEASSDLAVTSISSAATATVGETFAYTAQVTNNGPSEVAGVTLTDSLPANVTLVSANASQGSCTGTTTVSCALGTLIDGGSATVTLTVAASAAGMAASAATVASAAPDPNPANNSASATTTIAATATSPAGPTSPASPASTTSTTSVKAMSASTPKRCVSSRSELIHWRTLRGVRLSAVAITVNGKPYERLSGRTRSATVTLAGMPAGNVTVEIHGHASSGRIYTSARTYHPCEASRPGAPTSLYLLGRRAPAA
jgi:uncharacterized repeat protein (TIGR01451 family)